MNPTKMKRCWSPILSILAGLIVAQLISTIFVYDSNQSILLRNQAVQAAGYLPLPYGNAANDLVGLGSALRGGIFFTASLGAGLILYALVAGWLTARTGRRSFWVFIPFLAGWLFILFGVNRDGINLFPTLMTLFTPIPPFLITWRTNLPHRSKPDRTLRLSFILPFMALGIIWFSQTDGRIFSDVRNFLFWSNPVGERISRFYYDHTLSPAEVFKSIEQKTIRTAFLDPKPDVATDRELKEKLIELDFLPVPAPKLADIQFDAIEGGFRIFNHRGIYLSVKTADFIRQPKETLILFSELTDLNHFFRKSVYYSLLAGMPPVFFMLLFYPAQIFFSFFVRPKASRVAAGLFCLALGLILLMPILMGRAAGRGIEDPVVLLKSDSWMAQLKGLREIDRSNQDITSFEQIERLVDSPRIPIRYHVAQLLGESRSPEAWKLLVRLADDSQPNVACMAFQAMPKQHHPEARNEILGRFKLLNKWYVQRYAYMALRELGWKQSPR